MNRFVDRLWSILFLLVPVLGVGIFVWAAAEVPPLEGHWLPQNVNDGGKVIDELFIFILWLTGLIFVGTGLALFWFLWKYSGTSNREPVKYTHGSHTLEVVWSILPAATLLFIAIYQMNAWAEHKLMRPRDENGNEKAAIAEVTGRQFEWRIRYAGEDGLIGTKDDLFTVNELHLPAFEDVVLAIKTEDVLHSFFLPNLRVKQDVVPGMKQFVWFHANDTGTFDIVCAELCGWGHYKMRGQLVLESRENFQKWYSDQYAQQELTEFQPVAAEEEEE